MKKKCLIISIIILTAASSLYAHPPSDIIISFDARSKILKAKILHNVSNPNSHFIKKVDVSLNGKEILSQQFSRQESTFSQTVSYLIPDASSQDKLTVEAYCSISGKLERGISAEELKILDK